MISFWVGAVILLLLALAFVLLPLRRQSAVIETDRQSFNQSIFNQKKAELELEREQGMFTDEEYQDALLELQRVFLDDVKEAQYQSTSAMPSAKGLWVVLLIVLPAASVGFYLQFSSGYAMLGSQANIAANQPQSIEQATQSLIAHLQTHPEDVDGWKLLARTYFAQQEYSKTAQVYEKLNQLTDSSDPDALVGLVEAQSYQSGQEFTSEQERMLQKALQINPVHERALWYAGYAAYQQESYQQAVEYWQQLIDQVPPQEQEVKSALSKFLQEAKDKAGLLAEHSTTNNSLEKEDVAETREISVVVTVSEALRGKVNSTDTLFVYARAVEGPRMPLALVRKQAAEWPVNVVLNEQQSMMDGMTLANFDQVQVVARISSSGLATPQSGDLFGESKSIDLTSNIPPIEIHIANQVP